VILAGISYFWRLQFLIDPAMRCKFLFPVILFSVLLISCSGGSEDLARYGLKGDVKLIKEYQCDPTYENQQWVASSSCSREYRQVEFDSEGNFVHSLTMSEKGDTLVMNTVRRENGEIVEEIFYVRQQLTPMHSKLVPVSRTLKERVSDRQVNFEIWQQDRLTFEGASYYDSKGRVERQVQVVDNREVMVHNVYDKDLRVEMYQEESDGSRSGTQQYEYGEYDERGNWTLRLVYTGEEKISPELAITRKIEYR
jgi:hypothetical protein